MSIVPNLSKRATTFSKKSILGELRLATLHKSAAICSMNSYEHMKETFYHQPIEMMPDTTLREMAECVPVEKYESDILHRMESIRSAVLREVAFRQKRSATKRHSSYRMSN